MAAQLMPIPVQTFTDADGNPLDGGKLFSYIAGGTTPQATYTDQSGTVPNTNPVVLSSIGQAQIWLSTAAYKFILQDSSGNVIWTVDNVSTINPMGLTLSMFPTGLFTADTNGRKPFANGFVNTAMCDSTTPLLSANTAGRALMAVKYVTRALLAALGQLISSSSGSFSTASTSYVDVTNVAVASLQTSGRPVFVGLQTDGTNNAGISPATTVSGADASVSFKILSSPDGVTWSPITSPIIVSVNIAVSGATLGTITVPPGSIWHIDTPAAGTWYYKLQAACSSIDLVAQVLGTVMIAFEFG